jgi:hypothetical protein
LSEIERKGNNKESNASSANGPQKRMQWRKRRKRIREKAVEGRFKTVDWKRKEEGKGSW